LIGLNLGAIKYTIRMNNFLYATQV